ncbi:MAG: hypothetical protein ABIW79_04640 [Gemmatimonas sp.]
MTSSHLSTYLNDHLAGAVVAIGLMEKLESAYEGTEIESIVKAVRHEVEEDRTVLEGLIERVGSQSSTRKAAGWIAERFTELKLGVDDSKDGTLRLLESSELIALGIEGKRGLWRALAISADLVPELGGINYSALIVRAESQRDRMETIRLGAARAALAAE